ncbi:olfactory receptor 10A7-like [Alligator mississippiensis]|uniref:olfactory receptor 10A7-like n=1 Tax=Alligator mississippiensis TaxID=8496 RepID=UPI000711871C|nr:olfactory receptor 10A7-like [Alligator mississippiensis]
MTLANQTVVTEFILLGFSSLLQLQLLIFLVLLVMYIISLMGNILIIFITIVDPALSSPMYFFLRNLSFLDICFTTVVVPKLLANLLSKNKSISFSGCKVQMFFFFFFGTVECFLLAAMAYDRYVAIYNPLRYTLVMNRRMCTQIILASWISGIPVGITQISWLFSFPFCGPSEVHHFFCDGPPLLELVCADTYLFEMYSLTATIIIILSPFVLILASYTCIIYTVMKMKSAEGRHKAFSTCSSHLIVVTLMYGTGSLIYIRPKSSYSPDTKRFLSLSYTVITPMLNPLIYSLRNNEMKGTLRRILDRKISFW